MTSKTFRAALDAENQQLREDVRRLREQVNDAVAFGEQAVDAMQGDNLRLRKENAGLRKAVRMLRGYAESIAHASPPPNTNTLTSYSAFRNAQQFARDALAHPAVVAVTEKP